MSSNEFSRLNSCVNIWERLAWKPLEVHLPMAQRRWIWHIFQRPAPCSGQAAISRTLFTWTSASGTHTGGPHTVCQGLHDTHRRTNAHTHNWSWESGSVDNTPLAQAAEKLASPSKSCQACFMPTLIQKRAGRGGKKKKLKLGQMVALPQRRYHLL